LVVAGKMKAQYTNCVGVCWVLGLTDPQDGDNISLRHFRDYLPVNKT